MGYLCWLLFFLAYPRPHCRFQVKPTPFVKFGNHFPKIGFENTNLKPPSRKSRSKFSKMESMGLSLCFLVILKMCSFHMFIFLQQKAGGSLYATNPNNALIYRGNFGNPTKLPYICIKFHPSTNDPLKHLCCFWQLTIIALKLWSIRMPLHKHWLQHCRKSRWPRTKQTCQHTCVHQLKQGSLFVTKMPNNN